VRAYDTRFPQWNKALPHLLDYRYVVADTPADWQYFARRYPHYFYKRLAAPVTAAAIEAAKASPFTKVFVFSEQHKQHLQLLAQAFPELSLRGLNPRRDFVQAFTLADRTQLLLINRHEQTVEQLLTSAYPQQKLP
jgi:hypothetical protein